MGFGLGFAVARDINGVKGALTKNQPGPLPWSAGTYTWSGAYNTYFWVDPAEKLIGILMTQLRPNNHISIRSDFVGLATQRWPALAGPGGKGGARRNPEAGFDSRIGRNLCRPNLPAQPL